MININFDVTNNEADLLYLIMERATDKSDFRETWKSDELKRLGSKIKGAVVVAQQRANQD